MGKHKNKTETIVYIFARKGKFKALFNSELSYEKSISLTQIGWKNCMCIDAKEWLEYLFNNPQNATKDLQDYVETMNLSIKK